MFLFNKFISFQHAFSSNRLFIFSNYQLIRLKVPHTNFGLGRKPLQYGHAPMAPSSRRRMLFGSMFINIIFFIVVLDWDYIRKRYGFYIPVLHDMILIPQPSKSTGVPYSSAAVVLEERKADIHAWMTEQAIKRAKVTEDESKSDDTKETIVVNDSTIAEPKKQQIKTFKASVSAKEKECGNTIRMSVNTNNDILHVIDNVGFRKRKIIEYENRIRLYSTPDKQFRYFATYKVFNERGHGEIMMTPNDFLRSLTPGVQQPETIGLDQFLILQEDEIHKVTSCLGLDDSSIFNQLGAGGLITFTDYIFLLTVLSTSRRHFQLAFKVFDLNGDGNVDADEFAAVSNLMRSQSNIGIRHRDHVTTGSTIKSLNSGLMKYFFGPHLQGVLSSSKFLEFQKCLQTEILSLEFKGQLTPGSGALISETSFASLLMAHANNINSKRQKQLLKRVAKKFPNNIDTGGISLAEFLDFFKVLYAIHDLDTALTFHRLAGASIDRPTFARAAKAVAKVDLSSRVLDVIFLLFDQDGDGKLSNTEFIAVMKKRMFRGLDKSKHTGLSRFASALSKCFINSVTATKSSDVF